MVAVGIPPNIDSVQAVLSSGWVLFHWSISWAMPLQPEISLWLITLPPSTCGTKPYASSRKPMIMPMYISSFFFIIYY